MAREAAHVAQPQRPGCMTIGVQRCPFHRAFVVMIVALRFSMKATKSASRRVWCIPAPCAW